VALATKKRLIMFQTIGLYVFLFILTGCATTTDPRQGGLFSYNPKAYQQRLDERRNTMAALGNNAEEQERLEREAAEKRQVLAEQKKQLIELETDLTNLHQRIATYQAQNQEIAAEKTRLERDIRQAEARLRTLKKQESVGSESVEEKQAKIQRLRADIENLIKVLNLLMQSAQ
jgi:septal ring factor EnvC (AmiA/AmiB activator)